MRAERAEMMKTDVIRVKWDQASGWEIEERWGA
jgi:hypothetical protein